MMYQMNSLEFVLMQWGGIHELVDESNITFNEQIIYGTHTRRSKFLH